MSVATLQLQVEPQVCLYSRNHNLLRALTQAQVGRFTNGPIRAGT